MSKRNPNNNPGDDPAIISRRQFLGLVAGTGAAAALAGLALNVPACTTAPPPSTFSPTGEVEAAEYNGTKLTSIKGQGTNALEGTKYIDSAAYRLVVNGLVDRPLSLSYADLLALPQVVKLIEMDCVEGWTNVVKWTGPTLSSIFANAGVQSVAKTVIFYSADDAQGFSSLDYQFVQDKQIIAGMKNNDITLPADLGFPVRIVAEGKWGYKWTKWVNRIELSDKDFKGYWESAGYNNNGDINGPMYGDSVQPLKAHSR
jgi:DMSO/TMAO reductase YedYZ molybdopterin-dependent catalytic subunit